MTGRGAGYCGGTERPGYATPRYGYGRGYRRGWGGGWGRPHRRYGPPYGFRSDPYFAVPPTPALEVEDLKAEAHALRQQLERIGKRIKELESLQRDDEGGE